MKKVNIPNTEVQELLSGKKYQYLKYVTQILNLANQNAQGTRPKIVGQMSDLIQQFEGSTLAEWEEWYMSQNPAAIESAADRVCMILPFCWTTNFKPNILFSFFRIALPDIFSFSNPLPKGIEGV